MRLEDIGFYTLTDARAKDASEHSPLWRAELILTDKCNFKCPYCRGVKEDCKGDLKLDESKRILKEWIAGGLKNVRFSGGEPLIYTGLDELVIMAKMGGVEHIAISTNGSSSLDKYLTLVSHGVNDFSISLDACCASTGDTMSGGIKGAWNKVVSNIKALSKITYVTVGIVITDQNIKEAVETIKFAHSLGVADIRPIPAAQFDVSLAIDVPNDILDAHPILKYRISNWRENNPVRGIGENDCGSCPVSLDDMAVAGDSHYPCIIYFREQGSPIGKMSDIKTVRKERREWFENHNCRTDKICSKNCIDACVSYANKYIEFHSGNKSK